MQARGSCATQAEGVAGETGEAEREVDLLASREGQAHRWRLRAQVLAARQDGS
jgi:hypothetical protein